MLDLHVSAKVALQVELARAVWALEGLAASMEVHVAQEVVHSVERLPAHLGGTKRTTQVNPHHSVTAGPKESSSGVSGLPCI